MNMNNEEFDRKMAFIVEQRARFASDLQQLQKSQARTEQMVAHTAGTVGVTADTVAQMADVVTRLANVTHAGFTEVNAKINALFDAQIRTEENLARTEGNLARTQENLMLTDRNVAHTDESLKTLIVIVDRYLSGRNGK